MLLVKRAVSAALIGSVVATMAAAPSARDCALALDGSGDAEPGFAYGPSEAAFDLVSVTATFAPDHVVIAHEVAELDQMRLGTSQLALVTEVTFETGAGAAVLRADTMPTGYPTTATLSTEDGRVVGDLQIRHDYSANRILVFVPLGAFEYVLGDTVGMTVTSAQTRHILQADYPTGHPAVVADNQTDEAAWVGGGFDANEVTCL